MNGFEINKIIAAVIFTFWLFWNRKITDLIFHVKKPSEAAYKVEAPAVKQQAQNRLVLEVWT